MLFRREDDKGVKRLKPTPSKETLVNNLNRFSEKWKHISDTSSEEPLFREGFDQQVKNLRTHMLNGCLSEIPPGYSTSINESLHQKINDLFAGSKMGPELAFALLTVFFYAWNSRRKNKIRGIPIVEPLTTLRNFAESDVMSKAKESFGIGNNSNSDTPNETTGSQNELNEHSVITTCKRAMSMLRLHNTIKTAANNGSGLNWYDMFFHNEILKYICKESDDHGTQPLQESDTEHLHLQNIVSRFGLQVVPMPKDGDCLFNSVAFGIFQRFQSSSSSSSDPIVQHYASL